MDLHAGFFTGPKKVLWLIYKLCTKQECAKIQQNVTLPRLFRLRPHCRGLVMFLDSIYESSQILLSLPSCLVRSPTRPSDQVLIIRPGPQQVDGPMCLKFQKILVQVRVSQPPKVGTREFEVEPSEFSWYGLNILPWKNGWILIDWGNFNSKKTFPTLRMISNGLMYIQINPICSFRWDRNWEGNTFEGNLVSNFKTSAHFLFSRATLSR